MRRILLAVPLLVSGCLDTGDDLVTDDVSQESRRHAVEHGVTFENVSALLAPYSRSATGEGLGGVAWLDYDRDGELDLYLTNGVTLDPAAPSFNGLFHNNGDGTFTDVTFAAGVHNGFGNSGVVVGDIDNDGYPDMYLSGEGKVVGPQQTPARLYHNNGDGTFSEISAAAGVFAATSEFGAAMGDINGDGFLDIFVSAPGHIPFLTGPGTQESPPNKLYLNNGDLTFTEIAGTAGVTGQYDVPGVGTVSDGACVSSFMDYDNDGDQDILVGNCNAFWFSTPLFPMPVRPTPFSLFSNNGDLTFTDVTAAAGLDVLGFWMGLAVGDVDNDGDEDFFATSLGGFGPGVFHHALMINNGDGTFTPDAAADATIGGTEFGWGTTMADFDNDGDLDLFQVGALPLFGAIGPGAASAGRLSYNDGAGAFADGTADTGVNLSFDYTTGTAQGDYDGDGFADLVVMTSPWTAPDGSAANPNGAPMLLRNNGNGNHAITIRLVGRWSNRDGIGARVTAYSGRTAQVRVKRAGSSMASTNSPLVSFGIGARRRALVKVEWPSGRTEVFFARADHTRRMVEGRGWYIPWL